MKILQELKVPKESVNDNSLTVVGIPFLNGHKVKKNEIIIELETSKAIITIEAEVDGYIEYLCIVGDDVNVNSTIIYLWDNEDFQKNNNKILLIESVNEKKSDIYLCIKPFFSNSANRLILENNIDKKLFNNNDFVNEDKVLNILNLKKEIKEAPIFEKIISKIKDLDYKSENVEVQNISHNKKREIEYLESVQSSGLVSIINIDIDIENIFQNTNLNIKYRLMLV